MYSRLPVAIALAHIPTLMTHKCIIMLPRLECHHRLSHGVVHLRVGQMVVQQSAETEHRQDGFHPSREASANWECKLSLRLTRWHWRSVINYHHMSGSPHRQWADVRSPHQALAWSSTRFVSCALSVSHYQLRLHERSSMPLSSAAWTFVTASLDPRTLFIFIPYSTS